jgi:hypothetical protein
MLFIFAVLLAGCATQTAYLNTQKPQQEVEKDKTKCQVMVDAYEFEDASSKQKKFDQCMKDKGYNVVTSAEAEKIQGFKELWLKPKIDFKAYEAIFIDKVDLSQAKADNKQKVAEPDIDNLGEQMLERFSKALSAVMPVILDKEKASGKKVFYLSLKLTNISKTDVGTNVALKAVGMLLHVPVPLPDAPQGAFSFEGVVADFSSKEKLIVFSDEVKSNKNSSLMGGEKFSPWQRAYEIMDYWADRLAALVAKGRGQEYKSQLKTKIF